MKKSNIGSWLLILFDLLIDTKEERYQATKFRNNFLDLDYLMFQYSVYTRCAVSLDRKRGLINDIKKIAPTTGNIQCYFITDNGKNVLR